MKRTALAFCFALTAVFEVQAVLLPNGLEGFVTATNSRGDQVGVFTPADGIPEVLGFEITHQGDFLLIGPSFFSESVPGWPRDNAQPVDINNSGAIVGLWSGFLSPNPMMESFLYDDGEYTKISFCVILNQFCGDSFLHATEIQNDGDVVGVFQLGGFTHPDPVVAFGDFLWRDGVFYTNDSDLFQPIPASSPGTLALLALGFAGLAFQRRKRAD